MTGHAAGSNSMPGRARGYEQFCRRGPLDQLDENRPGEHGAPSAPSADTLNANGSALPAVGRQPAGGRGRLRAAAASLWAREVAVLAAFLAAGVAATWPLSSFGVLQPADHRLAGPGLLRDVPGRPAVAAHATSAIAAGAFVGLSAMLTYQGWYHLNIAYGTVFLPLTLEAAVRLRRGPDDRPGSDPRRGARRLGAGQPGISGDGPDPGRARGAPWLVGSTCPGPHRAPGPGGGRRGRRRRSRSWPR